MTTRIQLRGGTASQWTAANPILANREPGVETNTGLMKIGDGVTAWNALPYSAYTLGNLAAVNDLPVSAADPAAPLPGKLRVFAKGVGGRAMIAQKGPSGIATTLQPHLGRNYAQIITATGAGSPAAYGCIATTSGSASIPAPTATLGIGIAYATTATAASAAYLYASGSAFYRAEASDHPGGFHFATRAAFPDGTYDGTAASSGSRAFVGLTAASTTGSVSGDALVAATAGFRRVHNFGVTTDPNWMFHVANGATQAKADTGVPFVGGHEYLFEMFSPPGASEVRWRIENVTTGQSAEGVAGGLDPLPPYRTPMRPTISVYTLNAVARRLWLQTMYCESDR